MCSGLVIEILNLVLHNLNMCDHVITICNKLCKGHYPRDDTLFEKLITTLVKHQHEDILKEIAKNNEFKEILSRCTDLVINMNSICLAGLLKIFGVVSESYLDLLQKESIPEENYVFDFLKICLKSSSLRRDKSVANAMLFCLKKIYCTPKRFVSFYDKDTLHFIQVCLEDESLFVCKAGVELFGYLIHVCSPQICEKKEDLSTDGCILALEPPYVSDILNCFLSYFHSSDKSRIKISLAVILQVFQHTTNSDDLRRFSLRCDFNGRIVEILKLGYCSDMLDSFAVMNTMAHHNLFGESIKKELVELPHQLNTQDLQLDAVKLSAWLLQMKSKNFILGSEVEKLIIDTFTSIVTQDNPPLSTSNHTLVLHCISTCTLLKENKSTAMKLLYRCITSSLQSNKVNQACLTALMRIVEENQNSPEELLESMALCTSIFNDWESNYQSISKSLSCLVLVVEQLMRTDALLLNGNKEEFLSQLTILGEVLPQKLLNLKWEIRDSALEFVGKLAPVIHENTVLSNWMKEQDLVPHIWNGFEDGESYVRASAITSLNKWLMQPVLYDLILAKIPEEDIVSRVVSISQSDKEAFARRAAVELTFTLLQGDYFKSNHHSLVAVMHSAIDDYDWEVKMKVLLFWENYISDLLQDDKIHKIPLQTDMISTSEFGCNENQFEKNLETFKASGCIKVIYTALTDHDKVVQQKACFMLKNLKDICNKNNTFKDIHNPPTEKKLKMNNANKKISLDNCVKYFPDNLEELIENFCTPEESKASEEYEDNLQLLLSDILVSLNVSIGDINDEEDDNNAATVDCY